MNPETLATMNEVFYQAVVLMLEAIVLIIGGISVLALILSLICAVCGYFANLQQSSRYQLASVPKPPAADAYELLVALTELENGFDHNLTSSLAHRESASIRPV